LEKLAFSTQKFGGHVTLATPPFRQNFQGDLAGVSQGTCLSNLKGIPLTLLKQLEFDVHLSQQGRACSCKIPHFWKQTVQRYFHSADT